MNQSVRHSHEIDCWILQSEKLKDLQIPTFQNADLEYYRTRSTRIAGTGAFLPLFGEKHQKCTRLVVDSLSLRYKHGRGSYCTVLYSNNCSYYPESTEHKAGVDWY